MSISYVTEYFLRAFFKAFFLITKAIAQWGGLGGESAKQKQSIIFFLSRRRLC